MKEYRIGEFAKYLGVTPDLLKHYEDQGIISPVRSGSGYRHYPFNTTMLLMECIRLRNYGMTLREIRQIVTDHQIDSASVDRRLSENTSHLKEEMLLDEALTHDYEEFLSWREPLQDRDHDWDIRWSRPMCFLPHTDKYDFLQDPRIYEILKNWMSYIPIVRSTMRIDRSGHIIWGLIVLEETLKKLNLPVNDVVVRIPQQKIFYYKFRGPLTPTGQEQVDSPDHPAFRTLRSLNLPCGDAYFRTTLMPADWQKDIGFQYGYYAIPIADEGICH